MRQVVALQKRRHSSDTTTKPGLTAFILDLHVFREPRQVCTTRVLGKRSLVDLELAVVTAVAQAVDDLARTRREAVFSDVRFHYKDSNTYERFTSVQNTSAFQDKTPQGGRGGGENGAESMEWINPIHIIFTWLSLALSKLFGKEDRAFLNRTFRFVRTENRIT